jgi:hypothetical protein
MNTDEHGLEPTGNGTMKDMKKKAKIIMRRGCLHFLQALHGEILFAFFPVRVHPVSDPWLLLVSHSLRRARR